MKILITRESPMHKGLPRCKMKEVYAADVVIMKLDDGRYYIYKDKFSEDSGKYLTEEEVTNKYFLEMI